MSSSEEVAALRRALGRRLADLRKTAGYSQEALAPLTGYGRSTVANVEIGRQSVPLDFWQRCDDALGADGQLAAMGEDLHRRVQERRAAEARKSQAERRARIESHHAEQSDGETPVRRRAVLAGGLTMLGLPSLSLDDLRHMTAAMENARGYLDGSIVKHFDDQLAACASQDGAHGPKRTLPTVLGIVGTIERNVREVKESIRRELLATGARCAEFAGWLYRDSGALDATTYWHDRAMEWAQAAGDSMMQGYVLLKKSQAAWDERDAVRMLTLAQAVEEGGRRLPARVQAEAAQQRARGHAMLGDSIDVVRRELDTAHELLAGGGHAGEERISPHYRKTLLQLQTAICCHEAGLSDKAVDLYGEHLTTGNFSRRDYGYFASLGAGAFAAARRPDEAARLGSVAYRIASASHSTRTAREVTRVALQLEPWSSRPAVREFSELVLAY